MTIPPPSALANRYAKGIKVFRAAFGVQGCNNELLHKLIANCESGRKYKWPEKAVRSRDKDTLADLAAAAKHAKKLAGYFRQHPSQLMLTVAAASQQSGVYLRVDDDTEAGKQDALHRASAKRQLTLLGKAENTEPVPFAPGYAMRLAGLLESLAGELTKGNVLAKAGPMEHRWRHGPIGYSKPIDNAADLPSAPVCLAIVLSFLLRRGGAQYQTGERYNASEGRPHWNIVCALIGDTYPARVADDDVAAAKAVLRRNPDLEIWGW